MRRAEQHRGRLPLLLAAVVVLVLAALVSSPGVARAHESYLHGGIVGCDTCHLNAHTEDPPANENCLTCHDGFQVVRAENLCWTCHAPGQDMDWARTDAGCTAGCHLRGGIDFAHVAHPDRSTACTTCHPVTASYNDPAGSPHHVVPAPRLDSFAPAAGSPGAAVTLSGAKLGWVTIVRFGSVDAEFSHVSDAQLVATVPFSAVSGPVSVLSLGGTATSATAFEVQRTLPATLTLSVKPATLALGRRVRVTGQRTPAGPAGEQVKVVVQRRRAGAWKAVATSLRAEDAAGAFAWSYRPRTSGAYRVRATSGDVRSGWATFRVR